MNRQDNSLLVDVSNSRTKFALLRADGALSSVRMLPTADIGCAAVQRLLMGWSFSRATAASVVPAAAAALETALGCPIHWLGAGSRLNLRVKYTKPETLGADRLACAIALAGGMPLPAIAVDAGTAVTFDLVVRENGVCVYKGGAIAPGVRTMARALGDCTALLPEVSLDRKVEVLGRDTVSCIRSGLLYGFAGMVESVLGKLAQICPETPDIVFAGGDAAFLSENTRFRHTVDKMLVFKGLAIADRLNR